MRFSYTLPFSLCGWPCMVVRAGTSAEGMPIGVQIAARPWREDVALAIGQAVEAAWAVGAHLTYERRCQFDLSWQHGAVWRICPAPSSLGVLSCNLDRAIMSTVSR